MRSLIAVGLFLAGLFCLSQQSDAYWQSRLQVSVGSLAYTWDPANKSNVTLSNGNLTAAGTSNSTGGVSSVVLGVNGVTTGKKFFSVKTTGTATVNQAFAIVGSGFVPGTDSVTGTKGINQSGDGNIYGNNAELLAGAGSLVANDVIDIAVDVGAQLFWSRKNGGNWNNNGSANPATGTGGVSISYLTGTIFPGDQPWPNTTHTANFGATGYTYAAPSGFGNWQ